MPSPKSHEQYLSRFRQRYWISQSVHGKLMQHCILLSSWLMGDFHQSGSRGVFLNQAVEFGDPHREHNSCFQVSTRHSNTLHSPGRNPNTFYACSGSLMFSEMMKNKGEKWRTSVTVQGPPIRAEADLRAESQAHKTKKFILFLFAFQKNKEKVFCGKSMNLTRAAVEKRNPEKESTFYENPSFTDFADFGQDVRNPIGPQYRLELPSLIARIRIQKTVSSHECRITAG